MTAYRLKEKGKNISCCGVFKNPFTLNSSIKFPSFCFVYMFSRSTFCTYCRLIKKEIKA